MKILIVYDSQFGNTEKIARAIGSGITGEVKVLRAAEATPADMNGIDLLIVGSPTQGGRPTPAIRLFFDRITEQSLKNVKTAVFDTRLSTKLVILFGYAAGRIVTMLKSKNSTALSPVGAFIVRGSKGPLMDGEEQRAAAWGKQMAEAAAGK